MNRGEIPFKVWPQELIGRRMINEGREIEYSAVIIFTPEGNPMLYTIAAIDLVSNDLFIDPIVHTYNVKEESMLYSKEEIKRMANEELEEEMLREAIEREKETIRAHRGLPWWKRLIPFKVIIVRR